MADYGPGVDKCANWIERPTGILTKKDRQWLFEEKEGNEMYDTGQGRRKRRSDAAKRLRNGIIDFSVLMRADVEQRKELMDRMGLGSDIDVGVGEGIKDCIAWIYEGIEHAPDIEFEDVVKDGANKAALEKSIVEGEDGKLNYRYVDSVDLNWETQDDPNALREALLQGEKLDDAELGALVRLVIGTDQLRSQLRDAEEPAWPPTPQDKD